MGEGPKLTKLDDALALAARGFKVFPIKAGAKAPPLVIGWPTRATYVERIVRAFWTQAPTANIGIHCEGMIVIDVDVKKNGDDSLARLDMIYGLDETLTTRTPTGGRHLFYGLPDGHPGVANGVDVLGPGLDVRSTRGYVVAPGSTVPLGVYGFERPDMGVAPAPAWLLEKCKAVASPQHDNDTTSALHDNKGPVIVPDARDDVLARAVGWLRTAERSVRGQGGDQAAYRVACRLRDLGVSEPQAAELMRGEEWDYGCGWRDGWLEAKPIRSAYKYASGTPGSKAALPEDFPLIVPDLSTAAEMSGSSRTKAGPQRLTEFADPNAPTARYLIKGLLNLQSYALEYGSPGAGKTFVALDMAYHVAAGRPWMGRRTRPGIVLYLPYEGAGGMRKRAQALRQHYGDEDVPLYICPTAANLREAAGRKELGALIAELPEKPAFIVIDTLAHALCGGDENSAQDVGAFNNGVKGLIEHTGACVLVLHHPGKNAANGARGSSALLGAVDTELEVVDNQLRPTKQRDVEISEPIGFKLATLAIGLDEDGDPVTSCVVLPALISRRPTYKIKDGSTADMAFTKLCELRPTNTPITEAEWKQACEEFTPNRHRWAEAKHRLTRARLITVDEDGLYRRMLE
jgi:hypothetical protein